MVDYSSLENYRAERHRGFESLSLRKVNLKPADFQRVLFFSPLEVPFEFPFFFYESLTRNLGDSTIFDRSRVIISAIVSRNMMYICSKATNIAKTVVTVLILFLLLLSH